MRVYRGLQQKYKENYDRSKDGDMSMGQYRPEFSFWSDNKDYAAGFAGNKPDSTIIEHDIEPSKFFDLHGSDFDRYKDEVSDFVPFEGSSELSRWLLDHGYDGYTRWDADDYDPEYYPKNSEGRPMDGDTPLSREYVIINKNLVPIDNKDIINSLKDLR